MNERLFKLFVYGFLGSAVLLTGHFEWAGTVGYFDWKLILILGLVFILSIIGLFKYENKKKSDY